MPSVPVSEHFAWVTGWTDDWAGDTLPSALADYPALIHFPAPPPDKEAPLLLRNPPWVRPFELFARLIGMPGRNQADPSLAVALVAPLMFGYMFGDIGQGLVLAAFGWLMRHRMPTLRLLIPGGLAAAAFGWLFGSAFSLETLVPPLWVHPLAHPLPVLAVPLGFGAGLLLLSMLLEAAQEAWLHRFRRWLAVDAGLTALYVGLLGLLASPAAVWLAVAGLAWFLAGATHRHRGQGWLAPAAAIGELAERALQLLVNTLSFARVGAFTLAHAGLSQAVTSLAGAAGWGLTGGLILLLGNAVIIALEGLVVAVQTTRLVLFEFFVRFLHGGGRPFTPISPPAARALVEGQGDNHAAHAR
jgi:V/A-type H+-transporting ATPase subunit I